MKSPKVAVRIDLICFRPVSNAIFTYSLLIARQDGQDAESHLLAGHVFAATIASDKQQPVTKLAKSAFWVHQRQDVFHSISQQKPTRTSLDVTHLWEPGDSDDIYTWTKRSQKLAGETADFCFGNDEAQSRKQHFEDLQRMLTQWSELSWPAFQPVFFADSDLKTGRILPEIRFALNACCKCGSGSVARLMYGLTFI